MVLTFPVPRREARSKFSSTSKLSGAEPSCGANKPQEMFKRNKLK